jgi:hypothetical protein
LEELSRASCPQRTCPLSSVPSPIPTPQQCEESTAETRSALQDAWTGEVTLNSKTERENNSSLQNKMNRNNVHQEACVQ